METGIDVGAVKAANVLIDILVKPENLTIMVATWGLIYTLVKVAHEFFSRPFMQRVRPLFPLIICSIAVWVPGLQTESMAPSSRVLLGIILGIGCGGIHKIVKQSWFGVFTSNRSKSERADDKLAAVIELNKSESEGDDNGKAS